MKTKILIITLASIAILGLASAQSTVNIEGNFVVPDQVTQGESLSNQKFNVMISGMSADGNTDYLYFEFPNRFKSNFSLNNVASNISISSSKTVVDYDGDGVQETVQIGMSRDGEGNVTGNVTLDTGFTYPEDFESMEVQAHIQDSKYGNDTASLTVTSESTTDDTTQSDDGTEGEETTDNSTQEDSSTSDSDDSDTTEDSDTSETDDSTQEDSDTSGSDDSTSSETDGSTQESDSSEPDSTQGDNSTSSESDGSTQEESDNSGSQGSGSSTEGTSDENTEDPESILDEIIGLLSGLF